MDEKINKKGAALKAALFYVFFCKSHIYTKRFEKNIYYKDKKK